MATEGHLLHDDLACALAYALVNHPEKASDWWLSVGIVRQGIYMWGEEVHQPIHELVHLELELAGGQGLGQLLTVNKVTNHE